VCSPRNNVRYGSRKILQQTCEGAADIGAAAVIVHGGHSEDAVAEGFGRWRRTLEMLRSDMPVLIENTADGTNAVERQVDGLARLWEVVSSAKTGADRHANLGTGQIDPDALRGMIRAAGPPVIVETPGGDAELRADIEFVRAALS